MKYLSFILLWVFLIPFARAQTAEDFFEKAKIQEEKKDFQYASILIDKAIQLDDTNMWYWLEKADIQLNLDDSYLAIESIRKAIAIDSTQPEPYNRAGSYYQNRGIIDSAINMYDMAINLAPNDSSRFSYLHNRGSAKVSERDFEGGRLDYESVLKFDPNDIATLNNIASVYRQLDMPYKAIECLEKVISIDSLFIGPYINLGFAYSKLDSLDLAIKYFDKATEIDPDQPLIYSNRGYVYYKKGDYTKALTDINKSLEIYPTNAYAYRNLALVYLKTNNMQEACTVLDYAQYYGFTQRYGNEVEELINEHCKK